MAQILDLYGNPIKASELREPQTARLASLHREFAEHPARGLTPARLARILQEAEQGNLQAQAELFMDMEERDGHLYAEISKRKRAVLGLDWYIKPPRNPNAAEQEDAAYIQELLADLEGFEDLLLDLMDGLGHGYSAIELQWQRYGNEWLPAAFHHRPQSWFQLDVEDQNRLMLRNNTGFGEALQPFGWILHRPKARSGYIARTGLYRVLCWPYLFKHYATADLAEMLEIYGLPLRLGKYPPGTHDKEKATLLSAVTALGHAAAGIIPEGMSIEFQQAANGTSEPFLAMLNQCDASISKAVLGGTLTSDTSASGGGAYALGQVHNEVRHDLLASDAKQLAATLSRDLIWPLLMLNRPGNPDVRRMPRLEFDLRSFADITALSTALPPLVNIGLPVPVTWAQERLGIPAAKEGEVLLAPAQAPVAALTSQQYLRRTAALAQTLGPQYNDQTALDRVLSGIPAEDLQSTTDSLLAPLLALIERGGSEAELLGTLADAYPDMDESALTDALHKLMFAADAWGRLNMSRIG